MSVWLTPLPQLSPGQIDRFLGHNGPITDSPGYSAWLAMLHGIPRLLSQSRCLGYRMPLPMRSDSRCADITSESPALQVLSSVRFSVPLRSPCALFHANLLFFADATSLDQPRPRSSRKLAGVLTDPRPFLFSLANRAILSVLPKYSQATFLALFVLGQQILSQVCSLIVLSDKRNSLNRRDHLLHCYHFHESAAGVLRCRISARSIKRACS